MHFWHVCIICSVVYAAAATDRHGVKFAFSAVWLILAIIFSAAPN